MEVVLFLPLDFLFAGLSAGIKKNKKKDLGLIYSKRLCKVAGVFTRNRIKAAPVEITKQRIKKGTAQAVVVNSGNANACTGEKGKKDALLITRQVAQELKIKESLVLTASTGIIGKFLPCGKIVAKIPALTKSLHQENFEDFCQSILTTDTRIKQSSIRFKIGGKTVALAGAVKGAGMIAPSLATFLGFLLTDLAISPPLLQKALGMAVEESFNSITIDGEMSTNDTVLLLANGAAGNKKICQEDKDYFKFLSFLKKICLNLAYQIVQDGEGATKFVTVKVKSAPSLKAAQKIAFSVANSLLVKTALFGENPNWGRIISAVGQVNVPLHLNQIDIYFGQKKVVENGLAYSSPAQEMKKKEIKITIDLKMGSAEKTVYTSDLSPEYIRINAEYN
jgi:glutamate N-acetyltransferase/amino-acid N-acetyltransferase